jgi:NAD(P)-dependent dehydrogenase (short-subunit alcohol dehydrogenase family)
MKNYLDKFSLNGKTAFVTGGCGLIGVEICQALATAGANTVILDISAERGEELAKEICENRFESHFEFFDITDLENIDKKMNEFFLKYKSLDIWVNNAYPRTQDWGNKVEDLSLQSWQKNIDMHLNSYSWISRKAALIMKDNNIRGSIVNIGSIYGVVGNDFTVYEGTSLTSPMGYAAIKGGIINLSRYLASYFGKYGIRVNTVCPGGIFANQNETFVKNYVNKTPLNRMGNPEDIASAVLFVSSESASYITGSTLMVDGGWTAI